MKHASSKCPQHDGFFVVHAKWRKENAQWNNRFKSVLDKAINHITMLFWKSEINGFALQNIVEKKLKLKNNKNNAH